MLFPAETCTVTTLIPSRENVNATLPSSVITGCEYSVKETLKRMPCQRSCIEDANFIYMAAGEAKTHTDWVMHRCPVSDTRRIYLWIIPKPPDIGDCSHLAWPENHRQIDFFIFHGDKRGGEMNRFQMTCSKREIKIQIKVRSVKPESETVSACSQIMFTSSYSNPLC